MSARTIFVWLSKLVGKTFAQILCTVLTLSAYLLVYRLLVAYAPFEVDAVYFGIVAMIFHIGLVSYFMIKDDGTLTQVWNDND